MAAQSNGAPYVLSDSEMCVAITEGITSSISAVSGYCNVRYSWCYMVDYVMNDDCATPSNRLPVGVGNQISLSLFDITVFGFFCELPLEYAMTDCTSSIQLCHC